MDTQEDLQHMDVEDHFQRMNMDADMDTGISPMQQQPQRYANQGSVVQIDDTNGAVLTEMDRLYEEMRALVASATQTQAFREISVKVHIRRPERDSWTYLGRGIVTQEVWGQATRIVVRSASTRKIMTVFGEDVALQAEKRGNFVVVGCVEGSGVVSWSLNALNNSETLRLLASIDLACYSCKQAVADPALHKSHRRGVARIIKDDRRRRHKRRKDQDSMFAAFARTGLHAGPPDEPVPIPGPTQQ